MRLKEIIDRCKDLRIYETRCNTHNYIEIVFYNTQKEEFTRIFTEILGEPIKPQGVEPTPEQITLTKSYRGINKGQVLFKKDFGSESIMAMFWPWEDNMNTTVKIIRSTSIPFLKQVARVFSKRECTNRLQQENLE